MIMKRFIEKIKFVAIILSLLFIVDSQTLSAQKPAEPHLDSLFLMMNSNPDKVIKLGNELYKKVQGKS